MQTRRLIERGGERLFAPAPRRRRKWPSAAAPPHFFRKSRRLYILRVRFSEAPPRLSRRAFCSEVGEDELRHQGSHVFEEERVRDAVARPGVEHQVELFAGPLQ